MKHCFLFKPVVPFLVAAFFVLGACNDPIFYTVAQEVAPIEPLIKGGPTNFVVFNEVLYVASGNTLHWYKNGEWDTGRVPQPGGRINFLAVAGDYLYALCYSSDSIDSSVIKRLGLGWADWESLVNTTGYNVRSMYAPDPYSPVMFIGAENADSFAVLYTDGLSSINIIPGISGAAEFELCGVASDGTDYYLCTKGGGIYHVTADLVPTLIEVLSGSGGKNFTGIINLSASSIAVIDRAGKLYTVNGSDIVDTAISIQDNYLSTGALAIWKDPLNPGSRMLLAGRQNPSISTSSAYSNGYVELELDDLTGIKTGASFREPGKDSPSSIVDGDNERYKSTIGRLPINYIFQAPPEVDSEMRLFASTQSDGVWSYRIRKGIYQWNAED